MKNPINKKKKFGVRIFKISKETILVKQTIKNGEKQNAPYIIDGQKERHVSLTDDSAIAEAVRDGVAGKLTA
jgi:hypothetical protein